MLVGWHGECRGRVVKRDVVPGLGGGVGSPVSAYGALVRAAHPGQEDPSSSPQPGDCWEKSGRDCHPYWRSTMGRENGGWPSRTRDGSDLLLKMVWG